MELIFFSILFLLLSALFIQYIIAQTVGFVKEALKAMSKHLAFWRFMRILNNKPLESEDSRGNIFIDFAADFYLTARFLPL